MVVTRALRDVVAAEHARHPRMTVHDVQKLIYQSVFGGDHALVNRERFTHGLRSEWSRLKRVGTEESVLQTIDPEGRVARIHLAPARARGVPLDVLLDILWDQPRRNGTRVEYERRWETVIGLAEAGSIPFEASALAAMGFPNDLPHHSSTYGPTSYRLLNDLSASGTRQRLRPYGILDPP